MKNCLILLVGLLAACTHVEPYVFETQSGDEYKVTIAATAMPFTSSPTVVVVEKPYGQPLVQVLNHGSLANSAANILSPVLIADALRESQDNVSVTNDIANVSSIVNKTSVTNNVKVPFRHGYKH